MADYPDESPETSAPGRHAAGRRPHTESLIERRRLAAGVVPRRRHPIMNYLGHIIVAVISAFVLLVTGIYWNIKGSGEEGLQNNSVEAGLGSNSLVTKPATGGGAAGGATVYAPENFLLVGSDTRSGDNNIDNSEGDLAGVANTDSIMLLHISGDRQRVSVISLPRDLWVPNVECNTYDQTSNTYGGPADSNSLKQMHINAFYGVGGPKCLIDAVEGLTQLTIGHYIQIDFAGFKSMVDALGGIVVNACRPVVDATLGTLLPAAGPQPINGEQALNLARARKVEGDTASDLARIKRQQRILATILRTVKSAGVLLDPGKLSNFITAFTQNTSTAGVDFESLLGLAESLGDLDPAKVTFYTLPTVPDPADTTDRGSMFMDEGVAGPILDALRNDQPVPSTTAPAPSPDTTAAQTTTAPAPALTVAPGAVDLVVVNASGTSGVATAAAEQLGTLGFDVPEANLQTADTPEDTTTVAYAPGNEAAALTVAAAVPGVTLVATDGVGSRVSLRIGSDRAQIADGTSVFSPVAVGDPISAGLLAQVPAGSSANVLAVTTSGSASSTSSVAAVNASDESCL